MKLRVIGFLLTILFLATPVAIARDSIKRGGGAADIADLATTGSAKGLGYDAASGLYDVTFASYNWSAEFGGVDANGVSNYTSATTAGGNSWWLVCTGDAVGTAEGLNGETLAAPPAIEQASCTTNGERIRMYSEADMMLAADNTKPGGVVMLGSTLYHLGGCGRQPDLTGNGCPVLQHSPLHETRSLAATRGVRFLGTGMDVDGPADGRSGTWFIMDKGNERTDCGAGADPCDEDRDGSGSQFGNFAIRVGYQDKHAGAYMRTFCAENPAGTGGCDATDSGQFVDNIQSPPFSHYASTSYLGCRDLFNAGGPPQTSGVPDGLCDSDATSQNLTYDNATGVPAICVNNSLAETGTCSGNRSVSCTVDDETANGCSNTHATLGNLGTCEGFVTALETDRANQKDSTMRLIGDFANPENSTDEYTTDNASSGWQARVYGFATLGTCADTGQLVELEAPAPVNAARWPFARNMVDGDIAETPALRTVAVVDDDRFMMGDGGFYDLSAMPAQWGGRTHASVAEARCVDSDDGTDGKYCDELSMFAMGAGMGGAVKSVGIWYAGGPDAASQLDGSVMGFNGKYHDIYLHEGVDTIMDGSGWDIQNIYVDTWNAIGALFAMSFSTESRCENIRISNTHADRIFQFQGGPGGMCKEIYFRASDSTFGALYFAGDTNGGRLQNIRIQGLRGPIVGIYTIDDNDISDLVIEDVQAASWNPSHVTGTTRPGAAIWIGDFNGNASYDEGTITGKVTFRDWMIRHWGDNSAGDAGIAFFEGGTGGDGTAQDGSGRTVDDYRNAFHFENMTMETTLNCVDLFSGTGVPQTGGAPDGRCDVDRSFITTAGTQVAFYLGNEAATEATPDGAGVHQMYEAVGPIPSWKNITVNGVQIPDNLLSSRAAANAGDCDLLLPGEVTRIHDDTADNACTDAGADGILDGGGTGHSVCQCNGAGTWSAL